MTKPFIITVPPVLGDKDLVQFYKGWKWVEEPGESVVLDFSSASFVAPWAVTLFASYGLWLREVRNREVEVRIDEGTNAGRFLARSRLRELFGAPGTALATPGAGRVVPLTRIRNSGELAGCVNHIMKLLALDDGELADAIRYSLVELLRNVVQHARSPIGALVSAVDMPSTGIVDVAVADFGCGIRVALHERYREIKDDFKAVKFALQPHVSGTFQQGAYESMANNAGLGLFFIKEIVTRSGGGFFLGSGTMLADLWGNADGTPGKKYFSANTTGWRGTFALLQMRREHIFKFDTLLQRCREIAAEVRKDPTELKLDFLDDVPELPGLTIVAVAGFEEDVEAAAAIREQTIIPALAADGMVILDFQGIRAATQSFVHALMYRVFRDASGVQHSLSVSRADEATREAVRAVAAYARTGHSDSPS
jgi:hypothetical protein